MRKEIIALEKLALVNSKALAFASAAKAVKVAKYELDSAYLSWKLRHHVTDFVEPGSAVWGCMMHGTRLYYDALQRAKARERRAKAALLKAAEVS